MIELIIPEPVFERIVVTEFIKLPFHTQAAVVLVLLLCASWALRVLVNVLGYVWAVLAMEPKERIEFFTRRKKLFSFRKDP